VVEAQVIALLLATLLMPTEAGSIARHDGAGQVR